MTMPIITIETLSKIYGQANASTVALTDVSLSIEKGELVSLVGPSGCGKSTMLRMIKAFSVVCVSLARSVSRTSQETGQVHRSYFPEDGVLHFSPTTRPVNRCADCRRFSGHD